MVRANFVYSKHKWGGIKNRKIKQLKIYVQVAYGHMAKPLNWEIENYTTASWMGVGAWIQCIFSIQKIKN